MIPLSWDRLWLAQLNGQMVTFSVHCGLQRLALQFIQRSFPLNVSPQMLQVFTVVLCFESPTLRDEFKVHNSKKIRNHIVLLLIMNYSDDT